MSNKTKPLVYGEKEDDLNGRLLFPSSQATIADTGCVIKVYKRRWIILCLFILYSAANSMHWMQYSIIANIIMRYYNVSALAVDYTSLTFMLTYLIFIIPATYVIDKMGLRCSAILGVIGTTLGSWIKVLSVYPDGFAIAFVGQSIVAVSQLFILSVPTQLAAVWFKLDQVGSACSFGVFGTQLGVAVGFMVTPMMIENHDDIDRIGEDLHAHFVAIAIVTTVIAFLVLTFYQAEPPSPPSPVQALQREQPYSNIEFLNTFKRLFMNPGYIYLLFAYGINVGVFNAISTLLNQLVLAHFTEGEEDAGRIGLTAVVFGMLGSLLFGYILDKTHKFKLISLILYCFSTLGVLLFGCALLSGSIDYVYIAAAFLGVFMNGYSPIGFEYAAELTYPESSTTSTAILNAMTQLFGVIFTLLFGSLLTVIGDFWSNIGLCGFLAIGTLLTLRTPVDLRRQAAHSQYALAYPPPTLHV